MSLIQIGLVDKTGTIDPTLLGQAAAALNIQVIRDLPQFWQVTATVKYMPDAASIPAGVWPVFLVAHLPPGEGGFHLDQHRQPYAKVIATAAADQWTLDASHEILEMLVDPYGSRLQNSTSITIQGGRIVDGTSQFGYLVESCDPCEADDCAYPIQGIAVSDFITPHFYDPVRTPGTRYSFTGKITHPREILPGGYISWVNYETNQMQQLLYVDPGKPPSIVTLGKANGSSLREWVDGRMRSGADKKTSRPHPRALDPTFVEALDAKRTSLTAIARVRGSMYH